MTAITICGGGSAGDDDLYGQAGDDILVGGIGDDYLNGGEDNDTLIGNTGEDFLAAGNGNDLLIGGQDDDVLWGGNDADRFQFTSTAASHGIDSIMDFVSADGDRIEILASGFGGGLVAGVLGVSQFVIGAAAVDASDRLIYNSASGALSFDVDGSGSAASVQFATLSGTPSLTNSDIFVV